jgi:cyanate lyase
MAVLSYWVPKPAGCTAITFNCYCQINLHLYFYRGEQAMMTKAEMTDAIKTAKERMEMSWEDIAEKVGMSPIWVTSACLGMNSMPGEYAAKLCGALQLPPDVEKALQVCPNKQWSQTVPTDPLIYRFYEITGVYGETIKELIHEKFGDGIMSAIDFTMDIAKDEDPAGTRVVVTMSGKFLPYKKW